MRHLTILGSTGSIGASTLAGVVKHNINQFTVRALVAGNNVALMTEQCLAFHPDYACMADVAATRALKTNLDDMAGATTAVLSGAQAACELAALDVDTVIAEIVGAAGLSATLAAPRAGKRVLLANKRSHWSPAADCS